jgi:hypothetical protein
MQFKLKNEYFNVLKNESLETYFYFLKYETWQKRQLQ